MVGFLLKQAEVLLLQFLSLWVVNVLMTNP